ncbi:MAG: ribosome maturation factor RimM [Bacteroidales bacterium]
MNSTPKIEDLVRIGYIKKNHGINGALSFCFDEDFNKDLQPNIDFIFLNINNLAVPFPVERGKLDTTSGKPFIIIKLKWIDSLDKARELCTCEVYVETKHVMETQGDNGEMKIVDFVGFSLKSNKLAIGVIEAINNYSGNIVMEVNHKGTIIDIPFVDKYFEGIDNENYIISINYPQEMMESLMGDS